MSFLALLAALFLSRTWSDYGRVLHRDRWYENWQAQMRSLGLSPVVRLVPEVLLPAVAVYLVLEALQPLLFGGNWIVSLIPWWVGALTHLVYGWTMALVYPLGQYVPYRRQTETT